MQLVVQGMMPGAGPCDLGLRHLQLSVCPYAMRCSRSDALQQLVARLPLPPVGGREARDDPAPYPASPAI
eukprot:scaffold745_cov201-Prasinococcus_capsulatus_cf.AAC.1